MLENNNYAISIKDLTVVYNQKPVLWDLDLHVPSGIILGIVGPNGSGKTTLLKAIIGSIKPVAGTIQINAMQTAGTTACAYVPQKSSVDWSFPVTVFDVVAMGRLQHLKWYQSLSAQDLEVIENSLQQTNMLAFKDRHISQLSGGQQQRVFLARALAQQAEILILDEPFNGVDMTSQSLILTVLKNLQSQGKTIIVVHHDLNTVQQYFDWTFLMNVRHIALGPTAQVLTQENIIKTFQTNFNVDNHDHDNL